MPQLTPPTTPRHGCDKCPEPGALSPSQIKLFAYSCKRKWAFRHILKLREPEQSFQELGKQVHKHNEDYVKLGIVPPKYTKAGAIAHVGLEHLPKPTKGFIPQQVFVEEHLHLRVNGILFHGYADLITPRDFTVWDYKTTASFKYALSADELGTDPQALIYGMWLREHLRRPGAAINFRWMYYKTKPPYALRQVNTKLTAPELNTNFSHHVLKPAIEMNALIKTADPTTYDPNDLPGNAAACDAYGGCPYRSQCKLHIQENATMGMLFKDMLKKKMDTEAPQVAIDENGEDVLVDDALVWAPAPDAPQAPQALAQGVVPPDAPPPALAAQPEATDTVEVAKAPDVNATFVDAVVEAVDKALGMGAFKTEPPIEAAPMPRKRGRPRKVAADKPVPQPITMAVEPPAQSAAVEPPSIVQLVAETEKEIDDFVQKHVDADIKAQVAQLTPEVKDKELPKPTPNDGFALCINTYPARGPVALLSDVLRPIVRQLSEHLEVPYYRLAKAADYGRADALLITAWQEVAPTLSGYVYADKRDADTAALLGHLEEQATQIFRGGF